MKGITIQRVAMAVVIAACVAMSAPAISAADTIRIGAIISLSGNTAATGQSIRDGILLAVEEINKRGGASGNKIDIAVEDNRSDPQTAIDAFNRMERSRPPLFYLSFTSQIGIALAPLAEEKKVVLVGLSTSAPAFTRGREVVFQYWPPMQADTPPLLSILQDLKVKKLGIIYSNDEYGVGEQKLLAKSFSENGGTVALQSFEIADTDLHRQIGALKDQKAIFVATNGTRLTGAIHQLRGAEYGGYILTPPAGADPAMFTMPEMQGVYVVAPILYNPRYLYAHEEGEKFTARYQKPFDMWAANGYDVIKLISGLLEEHPLSREGVREVLAAGFEYSGVFGHLRVRPGEHVFAFPIFPTQILNNTLKYR